MVLFWIIILTRWVDVCIWVNDLTLYPIPNKNWILDEKKGNSLKSVKFISGLHGKNHHEMEHFFQYAFEYNKNRLRGIWWNHIYFDLTLYSFSCGWCFGQASPALFFHGGPGYNKIWSCVHCSILLHTTYVLNSQIKPLTQKWLIKFMSLWIWFPKYCIGHFTLFIFQQ